MAHRYSHDAAAAAAAAAAARNTHRNAHSRLDLESVQAGGFVALTARSQSARRSRPRATTPNLQPEASDLPKQNLDTPKLWTRSSDYESPNPQEASRRLGLGV